MTAKHLSRGLLPVDIWALTVAAEAEGEGREGMIAVAWAIRNRAERRRQTVQDVCLARAQFSCWNPGEDANHRRLVARANLIRIGQTPRELDAAYAVVRAVQDGTEPDPTGGADHYFAPRGMANGEPPYWATGVEPCKVLGGHVFLILEGRTT